MKSNSIFIIKGILLILLLYFIITIWIGEAYVPVVGFVSIITDKRKTLSQRITALLIRRIPSEQRWGNLSEHRLIVRQIMKKL